MKHLIVINRSAGDGNSKVEFVKHINEVFAGLDYKIYETTGPKSAISYLKDYFKIEKENKVRVYACGGDGTINEVVNGIYGAKNAELAIVPVGTGNDFAKYYGGKEKFIEIKNLLEADAEPIDLSEISGKGLKTPMYSINVINFGFDAVVGAVGNQNKEKGLSDPYGRALKVAMLKARFNKIQVTADGEKLNKKRMLLCTLAQGSYVGGKFLCAPKSINNDGLIDVCLIKCMTFAHLGMIMGPYTAGKHLDKPNRVFVYRRAKTLFLHSSKDFDVCVDGEMIRGNDFTVTCKEKAINFVIPK